MVLLVLLVSLIPVASVKAANYAVYPYEAVNLSLEIAEGGDATASLTPAVNLDLVIAMVFDTVNNYEAINLALIIGTGEGAGLLTEMPVEYMGLTLDLGLGKPYNLIMVWDPYDQPKLTGKNYTYMIHVGLLGVDVEDAHVVVRFEGYYVTEKDTNATGQFDYWAVVGSSGMQTWSFTIYEDGVEEGIIYRDTEYVEGGPGPDPDPGPGPGPDFPDLPTEPGSLFGVFDYLPAMVVFGLFGLIGNMIVGRVGILFGAVAALFLTASMGTIPIWVLYFVILVTIIVVVFKLKRGGTKVEVNGGEGA